MWLSHLGDITVSSSNGKDPTQILVFFSFFSIVTKVSRKKLPMQQAKWLNKMIYSLFFFNIITMLLYRNNYADVILIIVFLLIVIQNCRSVPLALGCPYGGGPRNQLRKPVSSEVTVYMLSVGACTVHGVLFQFNVLIGEILILASYTVIFNSTVSRYFVKSLLLSVVSFCKICMNSLETKNSGNRMTKFKALISNRATVEGQLQVEFPRNSNSFPYGGYKFSASTFKGLIIVNNIVVPYSVLMDISEGHFVHLRAASRIENLLVRNLLVIHTTVSLVKVTLEWQV